MIIFNLSSEMGTAGPGTHGVWTRVYPWTCGSLRCLLHFLSDTHTSSYIAHTAVWRDSGCGRRRGLPRMLSDAQRLPALCHVWVCGFFSESLKTPDAQGLSAKITCPLRPGTLRRRCPSAAALGAVEIRGAPGRRPEPSRPGVCMPPRSRTFSGSPYSPATEKLKTSRL